MIRNPWDQIHNEFTFATRKYEKFNSAHEGYAVIKEELDELWEEVRKKKEKRNIPQMRRECVQIAAMAVRFIYDVCNQGEE